MWFDKSANCRLPNVFAPKRAPATQFITKLNYSSLWGNPGSLKNVELIHKSSRATESEDFSRGCVWMGLLPQSLDVDLDGAGDDDTDGDEMIIIYVDSWGLAILTQVTKQVW